MNKSNFDFGNTEVGSEKRFLVLFLLEKTKMVDAFNWNVLQGGAIGDKAAALWNDLWLFTPNPIIWSNGVALHLLRLVWKDVCGKSLVCV